VNKLIVLALLLSGGCKTTEPGSSPGGSGALPTGAALPSTGTASPTGSGRTTTQPSGTTPVLLEIAAGGTVSNVAGNAVALACTQQARDVKGNQGTSWYMLCPPCANLRGSVWGTDLYTDDSLLCAAAVHAGKLDKLGGIVLVTWIPGQPTYVGSERNGVTTLDYGKWTRSFFLQSVDPNGRPTSPPVTPLPDGTVQLSCGMASNLLDRSRPSLLVQCPPGCSKGSLWGSDLYTADSAVCVAAVHAGVTTFEKGGELTLTFGGPAERFTGTARNGVTSAGYGRYDSTFRVAR
jgi:hypothetical protein